MASVSDVAAGSVTNVLEWPGWLTVGNRLEVVDEQKGRQFLAECDPPEVKSP